MSQQVDPAEMSILEHIEELRQRLLRAVIALFVGSVIGTFFATPVLKMLIEPLGDQVPQALSPTEAPAIFLKIAVLIGIVIAMPMIVYQVFRFVAPGLQPQEQRYILIGAPAAALSFAIGVIFAARILLRAASLTL